MSCKHINTSGMWEDKLLMDSYDTVQSDHEKLLAMHGSVLAVLC